jgi:hypothetical protein
VIANPNGDLPVMDANSNNAMFFGGDDAARADALAFAQGLELLQRPKTLASIVAEGTDGYVGLFIPGGHAPMADLLKDRNLGKILPSFTRPAVRPASSVMARSCCWPLCPIPTRSSPR